MISRLAEVRNGNRPGAVMMPPGTGSRSDSNAMNDRDGGDDARRRQIHDRRRDAGIRVLRQDGLFLFGRIVSRHRRRPNVSVARRCGTDERQRA